MLLFLFSLISFMVLLAFWQSAMAAREVANRAARGACERDHAQLLDGTVAFQRLRLARGTAGRMTFRRTYVFDYSDDGESRRQGFVILLGRRVEIVGLGPTLVSHSA
jgi:hypothetical protein